MAGIIKANLAQHMWLDSNAVTGKMKMILKDGTEQVLDDTFYWIIISMRSPYNGCLTDSMWVSYITLDGYPGFQRMVGEFLAPPFEFYSGLCNAFEGHFEVKSFEWEQSTPDHVMVCLDGDPTDLGTVMRGELETDAWNIVAPLNYPTQVKPEFIK